MEIRHIARNSHRGISPAMPEACTVGIGSNAHEQCVTCCPISCKVYSLGCLASDYLEHFQLESQSK